MNVQHGPSWGAAPGDAATSSRWLVFRAGAQLCALALGNVVETMRPLPVRHIVGVPAFVSGVALIRGNTVPVVDTANLLGSTSAGVTRFVTLAVGSRHVALAVDSVVGVRPLDSEEVLAPLLDAVAADVVSAVGTLDAELLLVLHGSRLLSAEMWTAVLHAQDS